MAKGIEWYSFVIFVIALVILLIAIFNLAKQNFAFLQAPEAVALEQAIACSYLRCAEGCASPKIAALDVIQCKTDFCNPEWTDTKKTDGKICDDNAKAHPVTATVASVGGELVQASKFVGLTGYPIRSDESSDNCAAGPNSFLAYIDNTKNGNTNMYVLGKEKCENGIGCENVLVGGPQEYYVWMETSSFPLAKYNIIVCSKQPVPALQGCGDVGGICRNTQCLDNEQLVQGNCFQHGGVVDSNQVCCKSSS